MIKIIIIIKTIIAMMITMVNLFIATIITLIMVIFSTQSTHLTQSSDLLKTPGFTFHQQGSMT